MPKTTKKTTKRTTTKRVVKPVVAAAPAHAPELHEMHCGCKCTPLKKAFYLGGMFILGFLVAYFFVCPCHKFGPKMPRMHPVFVNGCLDVESIKCPKMQERLATADVDANGCITAEEFRTIKHAMRREMREDKMED